MKKCTTSPCPYKDPYCPTCGFLKDLKPIFKTVEEVQQSLESEVSLLNRLIRQHPLSVGFTAWVGIKEYIEKELLGYEVTWES